jgi:hypothetical protein
MANPSVTTAPLATPVNAVRDVLQDILEIPFLDRGVLLVAMEAMNSMAATTVTREEVKAAMEIHAAVK